MFAIRQVLPLEQAQEEPFFVVAANDDVEFTNISVISEEMKKG